MKAVEVFGDFGDAFGVGVRLEAKTLANEKSLEFFIVGDDTIMNDRKLPFRTRPLEDVLDQAMSFGTESVYMHTCEGGS